MTIRRAKKKVNFRGICNHQMIGSTKKSQKNWSLFWKLNKSKTVSTPAETENDDKGIPHNIISKKTTLSLEKNEAKYLLKRCRVLSYTCCRCWLGIRKNFHLQKTTESKKNSQIYQRVWIKVFNNDTVTITTLKKKKNKKNQLVGIL